MIALKWTRVNVRAQIEMMEAGDERLRSDRHGGGGQRVFGLESTCWRWKMSDRTRIDVDGWEVSIRAREDMVGRWGWMGAVPIWHKCQQRHLKNVVVSGEPDKLATLPLDVRAGY